MGGPQFQLSSLESSPYKGNGTINGIPGSPPSPNSIFKRVGMTKCRATARVHNAIRPVALDVRAFRKPTAEFGHLVSRLPQKEAPRFLGSRWEQKFKLNSSS